MLIFLSSFNAAIYAHFLRYQPRIIIKIFDPLELHFDLGKELNDGRRMNKDENFRATFEY